MDGERRRREGPGSSLAGDLLRAVGAPLLGIAVATLLWPRLELPFSNPSGIVGPLTLAGRHPAGNLVRYAVFVGLPVAAFWLAGGARVLALRIGRPRRADDHALFASMAAAIAIWGIAGFAARLGGFALGPLDLFHDGELLVPAQVARGGGGLWTGSFFVHGLAYDLLATEVGWRAFGESVAGMRLAHAAWAAAIAPALAIFAIALGAIARGAIGSGGGALVMAATLLAYAGGELWLHRFEARDVWPLLALPLGFAAIARGSVGLAALFGAAVAIAPLVTIDRGAYLAATAAVALGVHAAFPASRREGLRLAAGFALGAALGAGALLALLGRLELRAFAENLWHWLRFKEAMDGYAYPRPFGPDPAIFTLPLLLVIAVACAASVAHAIPRAVARGQCGHGAAGTRDAGDGAAERQAAVLGGVAAVAALYFRSALGRPDLGHVLYAASFAYVGAAVAPTWLLAPRVTRALGRLVLLPVALLAVVQAGRAIAVLRDDPASRIAVALATPDDDLLAAPERTAAVAFRAAMAGDRCTFVYPSWPAWYHVLGKPPCTRFFLTWFAARPSFQEEVVAALESARPSVIVLASPRERYGEQDGIARERRFPILDAYLRDHYAPAETVGGWQLGRRRDGSPPSGGSGEARAIP